MNKNYVNTKDEKKKKEKKKRAAVLLLAGLIGAGALGGLLSTSAFFTDRASTNKDVNVGTLDMQLDDLSDLDGNYRTWSNRLASTSALKQNGQQADTWALPDTADKTAGLNDSIGIINPGDTGILAFKVSNIAEKSMDTAAVVTVEVKLPEGAYDDTNENGEKIAATLSADTSDGKQGQLDAGAYTIEGLGTPVVYQGRIKRDAKGRFPFNVTDKDIDETDKDRTITLRYYTTLETLKGTVENTDGEDDSHSAGDSAIYAYNVDFDRAILNKFQNATMTVDTEVFAKQHRDGFTNKETDFKTNGGSQGVTDTTAVEKVDAVANTTGAPQTQGVTALASTAANEADKTAARAVDKDGGVYSVRSNVNQTHVQSAGVPTIDSASDWSMVGDFTHVINGSTTSATKSTGTENGETKITAGADERPEGVTADAGLTAPAGNVSKAQANK